MVAAMSTMLAAQYDASGPPEVLRVRTVTRPTPTPNHVLVRVAASSINGADTMVRSGRAKLVSGHSFPRGTGFDLAGEVADVGAGVKSIRAGDAVWGFYRNAMKGPLGSAAEFALVPAKGIALHPKTVDALEGAALSGAGGAALIALRDAVSIRRGERVLIRGAGGGVGTAAVQIARTLGGRVTALVRTGHIEKVCAIGAEEAFDYRAVDPRSLGRFDVILDTVGKNMRAHRPLLSRKGRMAALMIGGVGDAAYVSVSAIFGSRRVRFVEAPPTAAVLRDLSELVDAGKLKPVIDSIHPLNEIVEAHRAMEAGGTFGKRVVRIDVATRSSEKL